MRVEERNEFIFFFWRRFIELIINKKYINNDNNRQYNFP
jgi:hypothetical protein